jgi:hypothetical protein
MLRKKLFTLACVLAILGIGACFLPPPRPPVLLPPPFLAAERVLAIDVRDTSPSEPLEGSMLSKLTADQFSQLWRIHHLRVVPDRPSEHAGVILRITILSKQAIPGRTTGQSQAWKVILATRMELVRNNGQRIWLRNQAPVTFNTSRSTSPKPFPWQSGSTRYDLAYNLALRAGAVLQNPNAYNLQTEHP